MINRKQGVSVHLNADEKQLQEDLKFSILNFSYETIAAENLLFQPLFE